jgi:hypothetical protein
MRRRFTNPIQLTAKLESRTRPAEVNEMKSLVSIGIASAMLLSVAANASYAGNFRQNHPRRAEVLGRTNNLQNRANKNYGHLGGHYGQITKEDQNIKRQEQRDARQNGGHITKGEQHQLNKEENHVNNQINRDKTN